MLALSIAESRSNLNVMGDESTSIIISQTQRPGAVRRNWRAESHYEDDFPSCQRSRRIEINEILNNCMPVLYRDANNDIVAPILTLDGNN